MIEPKELLAKIVLANGVEPCPEASRYHGRWVECLAENLDALKAAAKALLDNTHGGFLHHSDNGPRIDGEVVRKEDFNALAAELARLEEK